MSEDTNNKLQLELHVPDFEVVKEFYGKLGFSLVWSRQRGDDGDYLVMERDGTILNFWPGNDKVYDQSYFKGFPKSTKRGYGVKIVYTVEDIEEYYDEVRQFSKVVSPLKKQPWGLYDFRFEDPFGYYFRVTEPHNILDPSNAVDSIAVSESNHDFVKIFTDGGSRGNPGPSATGYVLMDQKDKVIVTKGEYIGLTTNNQAEYQALYKAITASKVLGAKKLDIYMDSMLIVNQMKGTYKVKNPDLLPIYNNIKKLINEFNEVRFTHVPRALNKLADAAVNEALDNASAKS